MQVKMLRTDDRLIHGQVMVRWVSNLKLKKIVIFDDEIARDATLSSIFELASPSGVNLLIRELSSLENVKKEIEGYENRTLIMTRSPVTMEKVIEGGFTSEVGYNIGPMSNKAGARKISSFCYLMDAEIEALKSIHNKGIKIFIQQVPDAEVLYWDDIEKIIK